FTSCSSRDCSVSLNWPSEVRSSWVFQPEQSAQGRIPVNCPAMFFMLGLASACSRLLVDSSEDGLVAQAVRVVAASVRARSRVVIRCVVCIWLHCVGDG